MEILKVITSSRSSIPEFEIMLNEEMFLKRQNLLIGHLKYFFFFFEILSFGFKIEV